jgi:hypothetical protein
MQGNQTTMTPPLCRSRASRFPFAVFPLIIALMAAGDLEAVVIVTDPVEDDGSWTVTGNSLHFLGVTAGISPTAGSVLMHLQNVGGREGTKSFTGNIVAAGSYTVTIDIGNFNNSPFADFNLALTGLTANGTVLTPTTSDSTVPPDGGILTWTRTYDIGPADPSIGDTLGFRISLPNSGVNQNASFDNLTVSYVVPEPSTAAFLFAGLSGLVLGRHRQRQSRRTLRS